MPELQRADMWKRISAALLDVILLAIVAVGMAYMLTTVLGYDRHEAQFNAIAATYESEYGVSFDVSGEELAAMTEEERAQFNLASEAFSKDEEANRVYALMFNLTLVITSLGILAACLLMEFVLPLLLGNGQTLGKKIFGIGVMRVDGIKLPAVLLFVRTVLGKYAVELMVPVYIFVMLMFGMMDIAGTVLIFGLLIVQIVLVATSRTRSPIHDRLAHTVAVDFASQRIFDSVEAREAYRERIHSEIADAPNDH